MKSLFTFLGLLFFFAGSVSAEVGAEGHFRTAFSSFTGKPALAGSWSIAESEGTLEIELGEDFRARKAPDLKLFLSPMRADAITGKNATAGSLNLGLLSSFEGRQRIAIPDGTDLSVYQTLIVHCEQYSKLWGTSALGVR